MAQCSVSSGSRTLREEKEKEKEKAEEADEGEEEEEGEEEGRSNASVKEDQSLGGCSSSL